MRPVPRHVWANSVYPDTVEFPERRLTATCLKHWGDVQVGSVFRWSDENIRLTDELDTSFQEWDRLVFRNRMSFGFKHRFKLPCPVCETVTDHIPKGYK